MNHKVDRYLLCFYGWSVANTNSERYCELGKLYS